MKQQIQTIILEAVKELNETIDAPLAIDRGSECGIYNAETGLDSIALVSLIVSVEQMIEDQFDVSIILANEKAMSQRNSPFRSVSALTDHALQLIAAEGENNE